MRKEIFPRAHDDGLSQRLASVRACMSLMSATSPKVSDNLLAGLKGNKKTFAKVQGKRAGVCT